MNASRRRERPLIDSLGRERHNLISSNAVAKAVNWNRFRACRSDDWRQGRGSAFNQAVPLDGLQIHLSGLNSR